MTFVGRPSSKDLRGGQGQEGSVKAAAGAAERSEQGGEPLQVPTPMPNSHLSGARDEKKFSDTSLLPCARQG